MRTNAIARYGIMRIMLRGTIQPTEAREVVLLSEEEAREVFRAWVVARGTQKAAAAELGVTPQHVCDILYGRRGLSDEMAAKVGLVPSLLPWRVEEVRP